MRPRSSILGRRDLPQNITMRDQHNILLRSVSQKLTHPLRAIGEGGSVHAPESALGSPVLGEELEVEVLEFWVGFEGRARRAGVAGEVIAFLGLREADHVFDAETFDCRAPTEFGGLQGAFERRRDDDFGFFLELGDLGGEGGGLLLAE